MDGGGDLGYQPAAALDRLGAPIKAAILKLRVGDVSPIMQTQEGFVPGLNSLPRGAQDQSG